MEVSVRGKHFDVPESVEERARRKFGRLDHYLPLLRDAVVEVDVAQERTKEPDRRYVVRATVNGGGVRLRAEERAAELKLALDLAARVLVEQTRRHKQRLYGRGRARGRSENMTQTAPLPEETPGPRDRVARVKRFAVKPMTVDEAVEQMKTLGHDFFVFHDADADQFAVLYRRRAGDYGLILPELS